MGWKKWEGGGLKAAPRASFDNGRRFHVAGDDRGVEGSTEKLS